MSNVARRLKTNPGITISVLFAAALVLIPRSATSQLGPAIDRARNPSDIHAYLEAFHRDPKRVMTTPLATFDENGMPVVTTSVAEAEHASLEDVWREHGRVRDLICARAHAKCDGTANVPRTGLDEANQVEMFLFEPKYITSLSEMEAKGLLKAQSPRKPWSDSYWPTVKGLIARRWLDGGFPDSTSDWLANYNYYLAVAPGSAGLNSMSPSEKYDYLVGDYAYRLTNANWNDGKSTFEQQGRVPGWTGLCHGWAPASFMTPAPQRSVRVMAANGQPILFYPSDIKALAIEAWGASPPRLKFAGTKCAKPRPQMDENGRVIDPGCFDVNPATWHIGIVNQMGVNKRSFVFDSQYDYQIWNYPVYSYKYRYFNPQTLESSDTLGGSVIAMSDYRIDKFRAYRSPQAKYVVGVEMDIFYSIETSPSTKPVQEPRLNSKKWVYDLELDAKGKIIGGEWYSNFHPDFMWNVPADGHTKSDGEDETTAGIVWDGTGPVPDELRRAALVSSPALQPVSGIVETLIRLSQETPAPTP